MIQPSMNAGVAGYADADSTTVDVSVGVSAGIVTDVSAPRGSRGPYKRGIERRREVVETAMEVFGENGFRGGTLQQVAERVGGTPAAILKLFGSKEKLLLAVLNQWEAVTGDVVGRNSRGVAHVEGLRRLMAYHVHHIGLLQIYTTMAVEAASVDHPAHRFMTDRYVATLSNMRQFLIEGMADGDFRDMDEDEIAREAEWLLAAMDGLEIQFLLNPAFDLERSFGVYVDRLLQRVSLE